MDTVAGSDPALTVHRADGGDHAAIAALAATIGPIDHLIITLSGSDGPGPIAGLDLGMARRAYFARAARALPARRVATADDIAEVVVLAATNPDLTGTIIEADGGARLVSVG
jgi:hypothetical protein